MKILLILLHLMLVSSLAMQAQQKTSIILKGKTYRPIDTLILLKSTEDARFQGVKLCVQADSTFEHVLEVEDVEEYQLIFQSEHLNGAWRPVLFFSDGDVISFQLHASEEFEKNIITGSALTDQKRDFSSAQFDRFSKEMGSLYDKLNCVEKGSEGKVGVQQKIDSLSEVSVLWQHDFFSDNPTLVGFYEYFSVLRMADDMNLANYVLADAHRFWLTQFPDHPLSEVAENLMNSRSEIKIGGHFVDFTLYEGERNSRQLSEIIKKNDFVLLDLWAPWCGPCIKKSKNVQKNFALFEEQGIRVVGVIGGIGEHSLYERAKKKYDYPWEVYPEVNSKSKIWEKYGISNAGGSQYLINRSGEIVGINADIASILALTEK